MLITQPGVMIRNVQWVQVLLNTCNFLSRTFPKAFCTITLTWAVYALFNVSYDSIYLGFNHPILSGFVSVFGGVLYALSMYSYFKVVSVGGGSPNEFEQLKIRNVDSLKSGFGRQRHQETEVESQDTSNDGSDSRIHSDNLGRENGGLLVQKDEPPTEYVTFHLTRPGVSEFRYCVKCKAWKPDRCHHCSTCGVCVLKMDHHCPWFASCIGYYNQKFFIQNLMYVCGFATYCFWVTGVILYFFFGNQEYEDGYLSLNLIFLFILAIVFMVTLSVFGGFSVWLVLKNKSTIEFQEDRSFGDKFQYEFNNSKSNANYNIYDVGKLNNWKSVMGPNYWYWLFPLSFTRKDINSRFNGINFVVNEEIYSKYVYNLRLQEQLNKQLVDYRDSVRRERLEVV